MTAQLRAAGSRRCARHTLIPCLVVWALLAGCSRTPPGGEVVLGGTAGVASEDVGAADLAGGVDDTGFGEPGTATSADGSALAGGTPETDGAAVGAGPAGSSSASTGGSSGGQSSSGGATGTPSGGGEATTGDRPGQTAAGAGPGIKGRTIKVVFHAQQSDCPEAAQNPSQDAYQKTRNYINEYVKFYNKDVFGPAGWKIEHTIVDDGGPFCPERQQAAAFKITKELRPFAVFGSSSSPRGPIIADTVTRAGILHIGSSWQTYADERARHPFAWNIYPVAEKGLATLGDWIDKRVKGTKFDRATPPADRVYGILGIDNREGKTLAAAMQGHLRAAGIPIKRTYLVSPDPAIAAQQGTTTVAQMVQDGVNTLVFGVSYAVAIYSTIALTTQMEAQNYFPDVLIGTYGLAFFDQLHSKRVWANAKGVSPACVVCLRVELNPDGQIPEKYAELAENDNAYIEVWQKRLGHGGPPEGQASGPFLQLGVLATGVLHAGKTLNASTFARSLESAKAPKSPNRCTTARFRGRDYKHVPKFEWDSDHDGGSDDFTTIYWVNQQTAFNTNGYYESYDNYEFVSSMRELPKRPSHDTGERGADIEAQKPHIGIEAWTPCSKFPNYPRR